MWLEYWPSDKTREAMWILQHMLIYMDDAYNWRDIQVTSQQNAFDQRPSKISFKNSITVQHF